MHTTHQSSCCKNGLSGKALFFGAVIGGMVGGFTALLFAPKSGEELRQNLDVKAALASGVDKVKQAAADAKEKAAQLLPKEEDEPFT
ncbi:MAG: YtxH domain-containing protein [Sporolactobacillus sp.]